MTDKPDQAADLAEVHERLEALEETVETVCRPIAEMLPPERLHAIELSGYEAQLKIAALEAVVSKLQGQAAEALNKSNAVVNSRIWQVLVKSSGVLMRLMGRQS